MTAGCILLPSAPIQKSSRRLDLVGRTLAHYRITAAIGEGGMGQVYRATDMKLGREVALKVLPPDVASDPERLARFQREARAVAALNHPHIVTLLGRGGRRHSLPHHGTGRRTIA